MPIDWISVGLSALAGATAGGLAMLIKRRFRIGWLGGSAIFVLLFLPAKLMIPSLLPYIQAQVFDYRAEIRKTELFAVLADQHPEIEARLTAVMKDLIQRDIGHYAAQRRISAMLTDYLPHYFATTSDLAMVAYLQSFEVLITQAHIDDPDRCRAFLRHEIASPLAPSRIVELFADEMSVLTAQVVRHSLATPSEPPDQAWVEDTLETVFQRQLTADDFEDMYFDMDCLEYAKLLDFIQRRLDGPASMRLLRGMIARTFHYDSSRA